MNKKLNYVCQRDFKNRRVSLLMTFVLLVTAIIGANVLISEKAWGQPIADNDLPDAAEQWMKKMPGEGTKESPKIIKTPEELAQIAVIVNFQPNRILASSIFGQGTAKTEYDVYLRLGNDIDLSAYRGIWTDPRGNVYTGGWVPIGVSKNESFRSHFDGANHQIKNMKSEYSTPL
jgi:hypothetical protein